MRKVGFALVGAASLALAACGSRGDDALEEDAANAEVQANELNALADNAALEAETEALGNQQQQLEAAPVANDAANTAEEITTEPSEVEDNVQGM